MRLSPTIVWSAHKILLAAVLPALCGVARGQQAAAAADPADVDLADRLEALAEETFPAKMPTVAERPFIFGEQAALLRAATALAPAEPRYQRKLSEALSYVGDVKGQYAALTAVATRLQPDDEFTWVRLLDLHLSQMQSADEQIAYLTQIEQARAVPRDVAAQAGARHARILVDQGKDKAARQLLTSVLVRDPLNLDALRMQVRLLPANASPFVRLQALVAVLKSNPLQPAYARDVARITADAGLVNDALPFYALAVNTGVAQRRPDLATALDWAAELYIANQNVNAYDFVQTLLNASPNSSAAWYLDLLIVRSSGFGVGKQGQDLQRATVVMSNRLAVAVNAVADAAGPATRPAAGPTTAPAAARATTRPLDTDGPFPLPDVTGAVAALKQSDAADAPTVPSAARQNFVEAAADLARLEIYFAHKPDAAAPLIDALRSVLAPGDPLVAQLQGLADLTAGQMASPPDEARLNRAQTELAAVGATDPLAGVGLVELIPHATPAQQAEADKAARQLIAAHAAGLVGAFVTEALVVPNPRVRMVPNAQVLAQFQGVLGTFPHDLFTVANHPQGLYSIHVEPVDIARAVGQPLLARITLFNFSPVDLTIGDEGVIRPGLLFQMSTKVAKDVPGGYPAFDSIAGPVVLRPREPLQQVVRVDQTALQKVVNENVGISFEVDGQAVTNYEIGMGGYAQRLTKPFVRSAVNPKAVTDARAALVAGAAAAAPQRLAAVDVVEAYVREMHAAHNPSSAGTAAAFDLANVLHAAAHNPSSPAVAAWATAADFACSPDPARPAMITEMAADAGNWRRRLLAVVLAAALPDRTALARVAAQLQDDPQPSVAEYARAAQGLTKLGPAGH